MGERTRDEATASTVRFACYATSWFAGCGEKSVEKSHVGVSASVKG